MGRRGRLSQRDITKQHAAELPERNAQSLIATDVVPLPTLGGAAAYTTEADLLASDQIDAAQEPPASGEGANNPNGTATSVSQT